jgi:hypothetical protein
VSEFFLEFAIANLQHLLHHSVVFHSQSLESFQQHLQHGALLCQIFQQFLQPVVLVLLVPHVSSHNLRQRLLPGSLHRAPSTPIADPSSSGSPLTRGEVVGRRTVLGGTVVEDHPRTVTHIQLKKTLLYIID